jgi:hypothetical protein
MGKVEKRWQRKVSLTIFALLALALIAPAYAVEAEEVPSTSFKRMLNPGDSVIFKMDGFTNVIFKMASESAPTLEFSGTKDKSNCSFEVLHTYNFASNCNNYFRTNTYWKSSPNDCPKVKIVCTKGNGELSIVRVVK